LEETRKQRSIRKHQASCHGGFSPTKPPFSDPKKLDEAVGCVNSALPKSFIDDAAHKKRNVRFSELSEQQFDQLLNALE
jgi:hypothetical protein